MKYYLDQCIRSVLRAFEVMQGDDASSSSSSSGEKDVAEIIVVDNHSSDGSLEYLQHRYPREAYPMVRFVGSNHNLGFARANNIAIRQSEAEYVLLLNPDTIVGEQVLSECIRFMDAHPDAGAAGVRMLNADGRWARESRRGLPTPMVSFFKMLGFCNRWPKHPLFGRYYMGFLPWNQPNRIEVVSGAFCMLRRKALDRVGLLDEDFFMYGEDIDLSYRMLKGGYHNYFLPLDILHYKGESTQKSSFRYVHVFYEAMLIFFRKHYAGMSLLLSLPIRTAIYASASVALVRMLAARMRKSLGFFTPSVVDESEYLLFDADKMSYGEILHQLSLRADEPDKLAIYTREIGKVITEGEVMDMDEMHNIYKGTRVHYIIGAHIIVGRLGNIIGKYLFGRIMEDKKIRLRALEPEDLDFLYEMENDESLWEMGGTNVPYSRQVLLDYITTATADIYTDKQVRLIVENEQQEAVGIIDLMNFDPRHQRAELGIVIKKEHQHQGLAQLAIRLLMQYASNVLHLHQIYAIVAESNQNAVKMLEIVGFQGDKLLKEWLKTGRGYEDAYFFQSFL